jgi:phage gp16-like protein
MIPRNKQLARVHALARDLGLSKEAYRNICASLTGKRSAGEMEPRELEQVISFLAGAQR